MTNTDKGEEQSGRVDFWSPKHLEGLDDETMIARIADARDRVFGDRRAERDPGQGSHLLEVPGITPSAFLITEAGRTDNFRMAVGVTLNGRSDLVLEMHDSNADKEVCPRLLCENIVLPNGFVDPIEVYHGKNLVQSRLNDRDRRNLLLIAYSVMMELADGQGTDPACGGLRQTQAREMVAGGHVWLNDNVAAAYDVYIA